MASLPAGQENGERGLSEFARGITIVDNRERPSEVGSLA